MIRWCSRALTSTCDARWCRARPLCVSGRQRHVVADAQRGNARVCGRRLGRHRAGHGRRSALSLGGSRDRLYTTPEDLLQVAEALGTGARGRYLLAATFGNVHGVYAPGQVQLRPQILADGQEALERAHAGARFQYVFHGSSGSSLEELRAAVDHGVVKVNLDSETQYTFTHPAAEHILDHRDGVLAPEPALGDKRAYDPRAWGTEAESAMAESVAQACEQLGSAGRSIGA